MDSQPLSASAKCSSSDFSIKRILGEPRSGEEPQDSPSWLCCTRYQPPRLPRSGTSISSSRPRRSGRHARVPFTGAQAAALEAAYSRAPYLAPPALRALAAALQLRDDRIKIWFQNRRARDRREKNGNITPPRAITLQPTTISRVAPNLNLTQSWNRLHSDGGSHVAPVNSIRTTIDSECCSRSNNVTSEPYPLINYVSQSVSTESDTTFVNDNDRCESPLDIETVDT